MGTAESSMSFVTAYPHGHNSWSNLYAGAGGIGQTAGGVGYFYPQAGTGYGFDRMGSAQTNAYGPSLEGLRTWQEAEAKHLKDGEEYRLRKYNEVKSMHDGFQESKRKSVEDTAIKNKMIYEQEREHVRRELGSEPYAFGGADGHSYPGYTGYGARAGGALGYSCHPNKPVQGHGYSADGKQSLGYPYRY